MPDASPHQPGPVPPPFTAADGTTVTFAPHPHPEAALAGRFGTLDGERFTPARPYDLRVHFFTRRLHLDQGDAERAALQSLARDETLLRAHGTAWQVVTVTARSGSGESVIGPVFSYRDAEFSEAVSLAVRQAREDAADWARLGLN